MKKLLANMLQNVCYFQSHLHQFGGYIVKAFIYVLLLF